MTGSLILHTPMPIIPLTQVVADMALIDIDVTGRGETCCFYGWGEAMHPWPDSGVRCLPHHLITAEDNMALKWLATTLKMLGEQVVVTDLDDWSVVSSIMPISYDDSHQH